MQLLDRSESKVADPRGYDVRTAHADNRHRETTGSLPRQTHPAVDAGRSLAFGNRRRVLRRERSDVRQVRRIEGQQSDDRRRPLLSERHRLRFAAKHRPNSLHRGLIRKSSFLGARLNDNDVSNRDADRSQAESDCNGARIPEPRHAGSERRERQRSERHAIDDQVQVTVEHHVVDGERLPTHSAEERDEGRRSECRCRRVCRPVAPCEDERERGCGDQRTERNQKPRAAPSLRRTENWLIEVIREAPSRLRKRLGCEHRIDDRLGSFPTRKRSSSRGPASDGGQAALARLFRDLLGMDSDCRCEADHSGDPHGRDGEKPLSPSFTSRRPMEDDGRGGRGHDCRDVLVTAQAFREDENCEPGQKRDRAQRRARGPRIRQPREYERSECGRERPIQRRREREQRRRASAEQHADVPRQRCNLSCHRSEECSQECRREEAVERTANRSDLLGGCAGRSLDARQYDGRKSELRAIRRPNPRAPTGHRSPRPIVRRSHSVDRERTIAGQVTGAEFAHDRERVLLHAKDIVDEPAVENGRVDEEANRHLLPSVAGVVVEVGISTRFRRKLHQEKTPIARNFA